MKADFLQLDTSNKIKKIILVQGFGKEQISQSSSVSII